MTQEDYRHPIAPPPELPMQFRGVPLIPPLDCTDPQSWIAERIYQMGADQQLEECCERLNYFGYYALAKELRAALRPKPPSLKEQALAELEKVDMLWDTTEFSQETLNSLDTIRRALEQLDD